MMDGRGGSLDARKGGEKQRGDQRQCCDRGDQRGLEDIVLILAVRVRSVGGFHCLSPLDRLVSVLSKALQRACQTEKQLNINDLKIFMNKAVG